MPVPNLDLDMNMIIGGDATSAIPGDELVGNSVHSMSRCPTSRQRDRTRSEDMDPLFLDEDEQLRLAIQNSLQPSNPHTSGVPVPPTTHTRSRSLDDDDSFQLNTELPIPSRTQSSGPMQHPYLRRIDNEPPPPPRCQAYNLTKTAPVAPGEQRNFDPFGANQSSTERPGAYSVASRAVGTIPFRNRISSHVRAPFRSNSNRRVLRTESGRIRRTSRVQRDSSAPVQTSANASSRPVVSHTPHSRIPQSNISPGLRDPSSRSFVSYTSHSEVSQSHIPPELRTRRRRRRSRRSSRRSSLFQFFLGEVPDAECGVAAVSSFSREQKEYEGDVQKGIAILLLSGIIVVAVTVGVAIAATNKGKSSVPIMSPAAEITQTPAPTCRLEIIQSNLEHLSRNSAVLNDPTSPQYYALTWIANDDEAKIDEGDQARLESRFALATFFFATNGANWDDDLGFLNSVHECNWKSNVTGEGVGCNEDDEIKRIIIDNNNLQGYIPEEIQALSLLEEVRITNQTQQIPRILPLLTHISLGALRNLKVLDLSWNQLERTIPKAFDQLTNLEELYLDHNKFVGSIPVGMNQLTQLRKFHLESNMLEKAASSMMKSMTKLEELVLDGNTHLKFTPNDFITLTNLRVLSLAGVENKAFNVPEVLSNLHNLTVLNLENTQADGAIPKDSRLSFTSQTLSLYDNLLDGKIPWSLFNRNLLEIDLGSNSFTGEIPNQIRRFGNLTSLKFGNNKLYGSIPSAIGDLTSLKELDLSRNHFYGKLPTELNLLSSLDSIELQGNDFTGSIEFLCEMEIELISADCNSKVTCSCCNCS